MSFLPPGPRRWLIIASVASASLAFVAFCTYLLSLDREIRTRFAGARWALPAQVYAAPTLLYPGASLNRKSFTRELERLGYRFSTKVSGPGSYSVRKDQVELITRPFAFWDGVQAASHVQIDFDDKEVAEIYDPEAKEGRPLVRLDPMLIGSIYPATAGEDRVLVKLSEVPLLLPAALIYVEDRNFEHHFGIDPKAVLRATWANLRARRMVQGGSTITQQLVRNFFLTLERRWSRKVNEAFMALLLEAHYSKEEILEAYLNEVHLGQDGGRAIHGFGLASQFYFNKPLDELQPQEIALLIGLVKGPSFYNPRRHPDRAKERRDLVLGMMAEAGMLKPNEYQIALKRPLGVVGEAGGSTTSYPAFVDLVKRQLVGEYPEQDLTNEGLRIFTTLEPRAQEALEKRLSQGLPSLEKGYHLKTGSLQGAGVVTSVEDGKVLALVGGREVRYAGFNRALDARRPIGSLAKPFVYLAALMQPDRYNLTTILHDEPVEIESPPGTKWTPKNYDDQIHGDVPLFVALAQSYNLATVNLGMDVGVNNVREIFRAAGLQQDVPALPSLFLGAIDLSPVEVAQMYATLAASGYVTPLMAIREVLTKEGQPLAHYPLRVKQTLPDVPVYLLNWALEQVIAMGTGASARSYVPAEIHLAGKTGTTDDLRDSWFAGYGDDKVAVIWVGRDDNESAKMTGAAGALQIWAPLIRDLSVKSFEPAVPSGVATASADAVCSGSIEIPYAEGHAPPQSTCAGSSPFGWFKRIVQ